MSDIKASSDKAHSVHKHNQEIKFPRFFGRLFSLLNRRNMDDEALGNAVALDQLPQASHDMNNLRQLRVQDVTIPKADIVAVAKDISLKELVKVFRESGLTRLPVYEGTLDSPIGFIHLKDLALNHGFNGKREVFRLDKILRPLLFVPPSMPIDVLLANMQAERRHMALVIDEYGGVDGLVTIEDLIEQVIGEIVDEHDTDEDQTWVLEKPGSYQVLAKTPLNDFEVEIGQSLTSHDSVTEEDIDTLGGLVFVLSGRVPTRGEVISHPNGLEFEVIDGDARRIKRLRVHTSRAIG
ncbi:MAG: hemolysin family protein [Aestuariivita sp.]|nr:hemolysin family protein [Aestuariivita sp.]